MALPLFVKELLKLDPLKAKLWELHEEIKDKTPHSSKGLRALLVGPKTGRQIVRELVISGKNWDFLDTKYGFQKMVTYIRLDLTIESLIVSDPQWEPVVGKDAVQLAKQRLEHFEDLIAENTLLS